MVSSVFSVSLPRPMYPYSVSSADAAQPVCVTLCMYIHCLQATGILVKLLTNENLSSFYDPVKINIVLPITNQTDFFITAQWLMSQMLF